MDGDTDPREQYVYDIRYVDAPVVRFHDANTDGTLDDTLYFASDANFNVTAVIDAGSGDVVERYSFTPYGQRTILAEDFAGRSSSVFDITEGHQGKREDRESGLVYNNARYLHASLGVFTIRDLIGYADGMNVYLDRGGNPINWLDSNGTERIIQNPVGNFLDYITYSVYSGWKTAAESRDISEKEKERLIEKVGSAKGGDANQLNNELRRGGMNGFAVAAENLIQATAGSTVLGMGGGPALRNTTQLGHVIERHGSQAGEYLLNRLKSSPGLAHAGQFLDNAVTETWLTALAPGLGCGEHLVPLPSHVKGRIITKADGIWRPATHAKIVIDGKGNIKTAYPEIP